MGMMGFDYNPERKWSALTEEIAGQALWYAWGRIDAGTADLAGASLEMGNAFCSWYGDIAEAHDREQSVYRPSIMSEWERFSTAGRIPASVFVIATEFTQLVPSEQNWREHDGCRGFDSQEFVWHCHSHQVYGNKY